MITLLEELSINAMPAHQTCISDGWVLRFSDGYAKRANSVSPLYPSILALDDHIKTCQDHYRARQLDTVFKLTSGESHRAIDIALEQLGYQKEALTHIMIKSLSAPLHTTINPDIEIRVDKSFTENWYKGYMNLHPMADKDTANLKAILQGIIPKTYFVGLYKNHTMVAAGLGVAERNYVGIYHVYVQSDLRRQGLGRMIMASIHNEAMNDGYANAYLQVVADNLGAVRLYRQLGYEQIYDYWYRIQKWEV